MFENPYPNSISKKITAHYAVPLSNDAALCKRAWDCPIIQQDRDRIAMDMHDGVIQSLFALGMQVELLSNSESIHPDALRPLTTGLNQVIEDIRHYIRIRINPYPEQTSLRQAIVDILKELHPPLNLDLDIDIPEKPISFLPLVFENICLMIKEALSNALRHAHAHNIQITAYPIEQAYRFLIVDDGQGFSLETLEQDKGMGLSNLQQRAHFYGGKVEITSELGFGTHVMIEMPL